MGEINFTAIFIMLLVIGIVVGAVITKVLF